MLNWLFRKRDPKPQQCEGVDTTATEDGHHISSELDAADVIATHNLSRTKNTGSFVHRKAETELVQHIHNDGVCVISLHGPSKQGKTTIIRNVFGDKIPCFSLEASAGIPRTDLYARFLEAAGAEVEISKTDRIGGEVTVGIPGLAAATSGEQERTTQKFQGRLSDADWVAGVLAQATSARVIVIDSFHHITEDEQTALAKDFTIFGGQGFTIVAAGTWKQGNYLVERNSDLSGQHRNISVDPWVTDELEAVVQAGANALHQSLNKSDVQSIARQAQGSVAALQEICQRYYLDRLENDQEYSSLSPSQKINRAAQQVSNQYADDMAMRLDKLSRWGATDNSGRHQVSFVVDAMLFASPAEFVEGFTLEELQRRTKKAADAWRKKTKVRPVYMSDNEFNLKVKSQWTADQVKTNNTPVFVWDRTIDRYVVNDAMLIFVHRTAGRSLARRFQARILDRLGY